MGRPRAASSSATRRPVCPVPPRTSVALVPGAPVFISRAYSVSMRFSFFDFTLCKLTHCKLILYFTACQVANRKPGRVFLRLRDG